MKKSLLFLILQICFTLEAQQNFVQKTTIKKEKEISVPKKNIIVDNDTITIKKFDENFTSKYKDAPFVYEYKTPSKTAWDRFIDWLGALISSLFDFGVNETTTSLAGIVFKIVMFGIIIFVIYLIVKAVLNKEGQWVFGSNSKKLTNASFVEQNLHSVDFEKLIKESLAAGKNRLSVRYYYLWLLKKMSDKELIVWDIEKTNSDYLYELKNPQYKKQFEYLSYLYNYIWYGEFDMEQDAFDKAKTAFEDAIKTI